MLESSFARLLCMMAFVCKRTLVWHGAASYGDRAEDITRIAEQRKLGRRLVRGHPVLEAEVVYAVHNEYCETPEDFIARRSRLAFLDHRACQEALPRVYAPSCLLLPGLFVDGRLHALSAWYLCRTISNG